MKESKLNNFGKHPGYRKRPMSLPSTGSNTVGNYRDWNDDTVYSEEPFGSKIGKSSPYDNIVDTITESIIKEIKKKR